MQLLRPISANGDAALLLRMRSGAMVTIECSWGRQDTWQHFQTIALSQIDCCSDQNSFEIVGDKGRIASSEWWGRCVCVCDTNVAKIGSISPNSPTLRDFSGNFRIQSNSAESPPIASELQCVNVYELQFAHCSHCLLHAMPCDVSGSRGAAAVAVVVAALTLEVGQVAALV